MDLITNPFSPLFEYEEEDPDELFDRDELISIDPLELHFLFELNKPMLSSLQLSNNSDKHVAFRVKTTNLIKYSVQPKKGIVLPHSQTNVTVTMQALKQEPSIFRCNDKFLVQCVAAPAGATVQDITPEMFNNEAGNHVEECKLSADFVVPSELEESEEEETSENAAAVGLNIFCKQKTAQMILADSAKNMLAFDVIRKLIADCCWLNLHIVPPHGVVFEIQVSDGYGARWSEDGSTRLVNLNHLRGRLKGGHRTARAEAKEYRKALKNAEGTPCGIGSSTCTF